MSKGRKSKDTMIKPKAATPSSVPWPADKEGRPWRKEMRDLLSRVDSPDIDPDISARFGELLNLEQLSRYEEAYIGGDELCLLDAVYLCAHFNLVMPEWVSREFMRRLDRVSSYEVKSLDDAFGAHLPKNAKLNAKREKHLKAGRLFHEIRKRQVGGTSLEELFSEVGAEFGLSMSRAREWYYWYHGQAIGDMDSYIETWK